jgi:hypothetical protein
LRELEKEIVGVEVGVKNVKTGHMAEMIVARLTSFEEVNGKSGVGEAILKKKIIF